ncbi:Uncharacterised protein [Bordetella pertussis]|nr:Uncharacterised protein [Bordetella pertussis]
MAREHPLDVAVHDGAALAVGEGGDGRGRGAADAGQGGDLFGARGKAADAALHDFLRAAVQVAGARVVAQAGPVGHDIFLARRRQGGHIGKTFQEALVIRNDRRHLRLLQHDFREPDAIGVAGVLPGQIVAAVAGLPGRDAGGEVHGRHYRIALLRGRVGPGTKKEKKKGVDAPGSVAVASQGLERVAGSDTPYKWSRHECPSDARAARGA